MACSEEETREFFYVLFYLRTLLADGGIVSCV